MKLSISKQFSLLFTSVFDDVIISAATNSNYYNPILTEHRIIVVSLESFRHLRLTCFCCFVVDGGDW